MSALAPESWEAIRRAALLVANGEAKRVEGAGWTVSFVTVNADGTIRIDIKFGAT